MDSLSSFFKGQQQAPPPTFFEELNSQFTLSYTKRIICFVVLLAIGVFCCFTSTWLLMMPRAFAKWYTTGSVCILLSTFFLAGPTNQIKSMCTRERAPASIAYLLSLFGTLYVALVMQRTGLSLLMIMIQLLAVVWYAASYIPFAQSCLSSTIRTTGSAILPV